MSDKENKSWYNNMSSERIDRWRIVPRLLMILYGIAFYECMMWFMELPEPSMAQAGFVSTVVGAGLVCMLVQAVNRKRINRWQF